MTTMISRLRGWFCLPSWLIILGRQVALEVNFDDPGLDEVCASDKELRKKCGTVRAKKIQLRLKDLRAAGASAGFRAATSAPCAWIGSCCYLGFYQCEVALPGAISVTDRPG